MSNPAKTEYIEVKDVKITQPKGNPARSDNDDNSPKDQEGGGNSGGASYEETDDEIAYGIPDADPKDPDAAIQQELISTSTPTTALELALKAELDRQLRLNERLHSEISKLKNFLSKRKQTYKRKRKEEEAPRKSLSAYNLFVRERFAKLAKENETALQSGDTQQQLTRIPPAKKVAEAGHAWKALSAEEKAKYEEMAKPDKDRYEEQMANYQAPEKQNRKRNKTGYNLFFSAHVLRMKNSDSGVPSERGSVARIVGDAWKKMSAEEKDFYEREADKHNDLPQEKEGGMENMHHHPPPPVNMHHGGYERAPPLMVDTLPPPQALGSPPTGYGPPIDRPEYMGHPPPVIHPPNGYYDSRYAPGPYGGYEYFGYPPPPPGHSGPPARGQPPPDVYAYPSPDYRGPPPY